jgi:hypothetical protein
VPPGSDPLAGTTPTKQASEARAARVHPGHVGDPTVRPGDAATKADGGANPSPTMGPGRQAASVAALPLSGPADMPLKTSALQGADAAALSAAPAASAGGEATPSTTSASSSAASGQGAALETVRQLVGALPNHNAGERTVINLEPPELGHLEIEFKQDQGRLTATVSVERPETLDLLRRHADMLLRDLAASGYAEAEVAFGDSRTLGGGGDAGTDAGARDREAEEPSPAGEAARSTPDASPRGIVAGRLDIRL